MKCDYDHPKRKMIFSVLITLIIVVLYTPFLFYVLFSREWFAVFGMGLAEKQMILLEHFQILIFIFLLLAPIPLILYASARASKLICEPFNTFIEGVTNNQKIFDYYKKDNKRGIYFEEVNDERLVVVSDERELWRWVFGLVCITCIIRIFVLIVEDGAFIITNLDFYLLGLVISLWLFLTAIFGQPQKLIFDRKNGLIHFPRYFFMPFKSIPLHEICSPTTFRFQFNIAQPRMITNILIPDSFSSFYSLYMDRNRPLPLGKIFDPYREKDFKRRQSEGFPEPICKSHTPITDDRCGYIYGTEELVKKIAPFKFNINNCYDNVWKYIMKFQPERKTDVINLILVGIWRNRFIFRIDHSRHQPLELFDDGFDVHDCYVADMKKGIIDYIK